jgi:ATP-dependent RNA helicase RhlB
VKDLRYLLRKLPHYEKRRSILFSNTLSYRILAMTYHYMNSPEFVSGAAEESQIQGTDQTLFHVDSQEKGSLLLGILKREEWKRVLVFANTPASAEGVSRLLNEERLPVESISSDLPQRKRFRLMARLNRGSARILVTMDADANAVFVEGVSHVINYDLPLSPLSYLQRAGRITASNGSRRIISFACEEYVFHLEPLEEALGYKIPVTLPGDDWFEIRKDEAAPPPQPAAKIPEHHEEKKPLQLKGGARIAFSNSPGGVFGLAVEKVNPPEKGSEGRGRSRRHRPRRPSKKDQQPAEKA